ncbi:2'-5' RNA ligase family protein [Brevundimonas sp. NIBR11]|uniref:2'-5' RNA ligase family protein n=1 Tax=Brevundimonas sp. NIBR11 TaxID=3015999 RepID=UPI0022F04F51|nr:2'-5' RNA ligase family protein [Brevundimonas sp. NIBR11]WGM31789.1 hypothetical protein KKHFBJBL_02038 [Brevundimonas sp. NIBR11]
MTPDADPLIVSVGFDASAIACFDRVRRAHFPPELNRIPAHLTLFHHLPGGRIADVCDAVEDAARRSTFQVTVSGLRKLGRGLALSIDSVDLVEVRARLAYRFADVLTPQDRQGFRPHVTIQNKVDPQVAAALHDQLAENFDPWTATVEALLLWRYRGGPWEAAGRFDFSRAA